MTRHVADLGFFGSATVTFVDSALTAAQPNRKRLPWTWPIWTEDENFFGCDPAIGTIDREGPYSAKGYLGCCRISSTKAWACRSVAIQSALG